jgi:5-methylcytosine-specific restriction endonuclease McrA
MTTAQAHREPPMPPHFSAPRRGFCRWCGEPINEGRRYHWHAACLEQYESLFQAEMKQPHPALLERQGGCCAGCGELLVVQTIRKWTYWGLHLGEWGDFWRYRWVEEELPWQDDHIVALADALPHADDLWWAFRLTNRQALCLTCHQAKTAVENARRARWRAGRREEASPQARLLLRTPSTGESHATL